MPEQLISISSPHRPLKNLPLTLPPDFARPETGQSWSLEDTSTNETIPLQADGDRLWLVLPELARGQTRTFRLCETAEAPLRAELREASADQLQVLLDGKLVTTYHTSGEWVRPFLWPLHGPGGVALTRCWPMQDDPNEKTDHRHHKSVWIAHGSLNGSDNWSEEEGHGSVAHQEFTERVSGPVFCRFATRDNWLNAAGERIMRGCTEVTVFALPGDERILDFVIRFEATDGPVHFGDTKEGGLLSLRLTASMNGDRGGVIENAYGGITEKECWGKPAPWVDYSGPVDGTVFGAAIFDHPDNPCHPTRWHVRDYGLFTANPFALHDYLGRKDVDGSMTLEAGQSWTFRYRLYLHKGGASEGDVRNRYLGYASPPLIASVEA
jgi:hypothetical protein